MREIQGIRGNKKYKTAFDYSDVCSVYKEV